MATPKSHQIIAKNPTQKQIFAMLISCGRWSDGSLGLLFW